MAHLELCKVRVIAHRDTVPQLMQQLQGYGSFHPAQLEETPDGCSVHQSSELANAQSELELYTRAIELLEPYRKRAGFLDELFAPPVELDENDCTRLLRDDKPSSVATSIVELDRERTKVEKECESLLTKADALHIWKDLQLTARQLSESRRVRFEAGLLPRGAIDTIRSSLAQHGSHWDLHALAADKSSMVSPVIFTCLAADAPTYLPVLNEAGFQDFRLPNEFPPAREEIRLRDLAQEKRLQVEQCTKRLAAMAREVVALRLAFDEAKAQVLRLQGEQSAITTRSALALEGWIPVGDFPNVKHRIEALHTAVIERIKPAENELAPVALTNNAFASPFQVVTDLYATPRSNEVDPTPFLAPFFAIYFGVCLTDAGYGIILLLISMGILWKARPTGAFRQLLATFGICAVFTIIVGSLTGGVFGILQSQAAMEAFPGVTSTFQSIQIFDPMKDQIFFFKLVLLFGVVQVAFGYILKAWSNVKSNKVADAIYDQASWLLILGGAFTLALGAMGTISQGSARYVGGGIMMLGGLLVMLFAGREEDNLFIRLASGMYALYGVTGLFGDILSYSRLLALGIATGVIAGVVNTIAALVFEIPNGVGVVLALLILVVGHLANIGINCMGAFVHTVRLQFVEFFTKFYEGGGEPFRPLVEERQYTVVRQRNARP